MEYKLNFGMWNGIFAVPNDIIDNHIKLCGATSLRVILLILRNNQNSISIIDIAKALGISVEDAQDALNYWINCDVISSNVVTQKIVEKSASNLNIATLSVTNIKSSDLQELAQKDENINMLILEIQKSFGKPLASIEMESIINLYVSFGISPEVILKVLEYASIRKKLNTRYIERVATEWAEAEIDTIEKADVYIKECIIRTNQENHVKIAFGIHNRALVSTEREYIKSWYLMKFDIQMIKLAYERTIEAINKLSFNYINKILLSWNEKNITTVEQAAQEKTEYLFEKELTKTTISPKAIMGKRMSKSAASKNPSSKPSYDIDEIEKMITYSHL